MQQTRQYILDILRERGEATVDDLVKELHIRLNHAIRTVTVRHHLDILRLDEMIAEPIVRRRTGPGRPQFIYTLTDKARAVFPNNYQLLAATLIDQLKMSLPPPQINVIMEGVADQMVEQVDEVNSALSLKQMTTEERLEYTIGYLNEHGYDASWERTSEGYLLLTRNCPYRDVVEDHRELCTLDMRLIAGLVGIIPRSLGRLVEQAESCAYLLPSAALSSNNTNTHNKVTQN